MRPSDTENFLAIADVVAQRSLCSRAQVGAVIVSSDQIVVSTGRNGPPRFFQHNEQSCTSWCDRARGIAQGGSELLYAGCPSIHAEGNALLSGDRSARMGGTIYVTTEMCWECCKLVANSGLSQAVVRYDPEAYERRGSERGYHLLQRVGVEVLRFGGPSGTAGRWLVPSYYEEDTK